MLIVIESAISCVLQNKHVSSCPELSLSCAQDILPAPPLTVLVVDGTALSAVYVIDRREGEAGELQHGGHQAQQVVLLGCRQPQALQGTLDTTNKLFFWGRRVTLLTRNYRF